MLKLKTWLRANLTPQRYRALANAKRAVLRSRAIQVSGAWLLQDDLNGLARLFGTDKWGAHWYTQHYQRYFRALKHKRLNVLEIGVGGYSKSHRGGASLRMWKAYFRRSRIVGLDLYDKRHFSEKRIDIRQGDQTDADMLRRLSQEYGGFDIVIDDGSHMNGDVIKTFEILFPLLRDGGIYAVEDTQTAYWPTWGGGLHNPNTSTAFFKGLTDGLNYAEYPVAGYQPTYFERNAVEIAFFHNLIILRKGGNNEKCNVPELIERELDTAKHVEARSPSSLQIA